MVYSKELLTKTLESTNFGGGRINRTGTNAYDINYFITDHLGSTRVIVDNNGEIKEQKDYYPFGKEHENPDLIASTNRYTFSGKEKQTIKDLGWLDFSARMLETEFGRWLVPDPLAEKYYSISPYAYCMNNPLLFIDPDGRDVDISKLTNQNHVVALERFINTTEGYNFINRFMNKGETLKIGDNAYSFSKSGDRAKDILSLESADLDKNTLGKSEIFTKNEDGTKGSKMRNVMNLENINITDGTYQVIMLDTKIDDKQATNTLGHEAFVHTDRRSNELSNIERELNIGRSGKYFNNLDAYRGDMKDMIYRADRDHSNLRNGLIKRYETFSKQLDLKYKGGKYYEKYRKDAFGK
ncbi:MAG: RHS repeat-associated core domain-containing protein [Prevotellaceae bacterium]|jgi:RHS repeat-associated protein|nr:RHS repeat-associated core domain-containing protein [Prevotellaceae bacterium]